MGNAHDLEGIYAATSAANNCEMCLSFHAMVLQKDDAVADIDEIVAGGLPKDANTRALVLATKYALAHKGIILPREKKHLASFGFNSEEKMLEIIFASGIMSTMNACYISMIANGMEVE